MLYFPLEDADKDAGSTTTHGGGVPMAFKGEGGGDGLLAFFVWVFELSCFSTSRERYDLRCPRIGFRYKENRVQNHPKDDELTQQPLLFMACTFAECQRNGCHSNGL